MTEETEDQRWERLSRDRVQRPLPRRFYKEVAVSDDLGILLDGRGVKTPLKARLQLPGKALAQAVAEEWQAQEKDINPDLMPLTKLANTAIDRVAAERGHVEGELVAYAGNDLVCYRADEPEALVRLQAKHWDPVISWAKASLDVHVVATAGIIHKPQHPQALSAVASAAAGLDDFALAAVHTAMTLTGSALLALMLHARAITAAAAWMAAHVDEDFQISQWGEDYEAAERRAIRQAEFMATARFLELLASP